MKLRIKGNSLRYRLTKTDVSNLQTQGIITETVDFGDQKLLYVLKQANQDGLHADFVNNVISIFMPTIMVQELATTNRVGYNGTYNNLDLLIEKDFACLDSVDEDQSDNYPNPLADK